MTVQQRGTGWRVTFENATELVVIDASTAKLNAWVRELAATMAAADHDSSANPHAVQALTVQPTYWPGAIVEP